MKNRSYLALALVVLIGAVMLVAACSSPAPTPAPTPAKPAPATTSAAPPSTSVAPTTTTSAPVSTAVPKPTSSPTPSPSPTPAPAFTKPKNVTFQAAYGVGGGGDTMIRGIAPYLQKYLGVPIAVENKTSAGGIQAINYVYGQAADGSQILFCAQSHGIKADIMGASLAFTKPYLQAFIPVARLAIPEPEVLVTNKDSPLKTLEDFIKAGKEKALKYGLVGYGGTDHITALAIYKNLGIKKFTWVTYPGGGESFLAVRGGFIDVTVSGLSRTLTDPTAYNLLATTSEQRAKDLPNVPTYTEKGFPALKAGILLGTTYGFFVKEGTSPALISWLEDGVKKTLADADVQAWATKATIPLSFADGKTWGDVNSQFISGATPLIPEIKEDVAKSQGS